MSPDVHQLLREIRFSLVRFEEDEDIEALDDAQNMITEIFNLVDDSD